MVREEWYVIVNPRAGSGKTMSKWMPAEKKLRELGVPIYMVYTNYKHHAVELAATAARLGYRKIMAVGGDGSLHEIFNGVLAWCSYSGIDPSEFYLAVMPIGSGNDWIKAFGIPNDTDVVPGIIANGRFAKEDIVKITNAEGEDRYMANIGGFGFDSHVSERVNRQKERGFRSKRIYINALIYTVFHLKPINISVSKDGEQIFSGEALSVALGNGKYSGGGMKQTCIADPTDGILDMLICPKMSLGTIFKEIRHIFQGTTHLSSSLIYARGKSFEVTPLDEKSTDYIELDGEFAGHIPARIELTGAHINVLTNR